MTCLSSMNVRKVNRSHIYHLWDSNHQNMAALSVWFTNITLWEFNTTIVNGQLDPFRVSFSTKNRGFHSHVNLPESVSCCVPNETHRKAAQARACAARSHPSKPGRQAKLASGSGLGSSQSQFLNLPSGYD